MKRISKVLSFTFLAAATAGLTAGGVFLSTPPQAAQASFTQQQITNSLPAFFDQSGLAPNDTYFSKAVPIKFNTSLEDRGTASDGTALYTFKYSTNLTNQDSYSYFEITNLSFLLNGKPLASTDKNGKNLSSLIMQATDPTKFDGSNIHPQTLNMTIEYDHSIGSGKYEIIEPNVGRNEAGEFVITPAVLKLGDTGIVEMSLQYNEYSVTKVESTTNPNDFSEITTSVSTNNPVSYTAFLLNENDYFETADRFSPKVTYDRASLKRTLSDAASTHRYNYFFNYTTNNIPYISVNPNRVRVTVTKNYNNSSHSSTIVYDPETKTAIAPDFVQDVVVTDDMMRIYLNNVGSYNFDFDLIYTYSVTNTLSNQTSYYVCDIDDDKVLDQRAYLFGQQIQYTDYSDNNFKEFKTIKDLKITNSANVTHLAGSMNGEAFRTSLINSSDITPVSTNQTPIKLVNNSSVAGASLYKLNEAGDAWEKVDNNKFDVTTNISDPGTYFIETTYSFASYTNEYGSPAADQTFNQYFYFKIEKLTPAFSVYAQTGVDSEGEPTYSETELYSGKFTNAKHVKIKFDDFGKEFNSDVRFELVRKSFSGQTDPAIRIMTDSGEHVVEDEGIYTIRVYYGKQGLAEKPIERRFTIDRQEITGLSAYTVTNSRIANAVSGSTNQPFVFTWKNEKDSGAKTFGYYKYFSLSYNNYYGGLSSLDLSSLIYTQLNQNNMLATDRVLNLSGGSWTSYSNSEHLLGSNATVPSSRIKESAGLYVFEIFDEAGNSKTQIILLDDSRPIFALETEEGYSLISNHHTLTTDAKLHWAGRKAISISGDLENELLFRNKDNDLDSSIADAFDEFKKSVETFSNLGQSKNGSYYLVDILDRFGYKDRSSNDISLESGNSKEIKFSYTVHYTLQGSNPTYYFSTTQRELDQAYYINVATGELMLDADIIRTQGTLHTANVYSAMEASGKTYYYGMKDSTTIVSLSGQTFNATLQNGKLVLNGNVLSQERFVDMEGEYNFLIIDKSNTQGLSFDETQRYLNYSSAYQYIKVTSDDSRTQIYFEQTSAVGSETEKIELTEAAFSINGTREDNIDHTFRSSFYNPTSLNQILHISFVPTTTTSSGITQVEKVTLQFFPFETKVVANLDANQNPTLSFYRTLSSTPLFTTPVYEFATHGAIEGEFERDINVSSNVTTDGKYVITRTYMLGDDYIVDVFDYYERNLTAIVDRYGVITSPQSISYEATEYAYSVGERNFTVTQLENILEFASDDGFFPSYDLTVNGQDVPLISAISNMSTGKRYYVFDSIESFSLSENGAPVVPTTTSTTFGPSLESIVGGDIFVNMYDGIGSNSGVISVSFPYYKGMLPSGDNFYTDDKTNWDMENVASDTPSSRLVTNKLPAKLYIPAVKYTMYNKEQLIGTDYDTYSFSSVINDGLTYYDTAYASSAISYYQLTAQVDFTGTDGERRTYYSNGSTRGFLNFYDADGEELGDLYKAGIYTVTITQANNAVGNTSNNFRKNYRFSFEILSQSPEFELSASGRPLKSLDDVTYFSNSKSATITWQDVDDRYIANIDKSNITLTLPGMTQSISVDPENGVSINTNRPNDELTLQQKNLLKNLSYVKNDSTNRLTINFDGLSLYKNGSQIYITMQFEGHNDELKYYSRTTKSIKIDKQASHEQIDSLIEKLGLFSTSALKLDGSTLRNYLDIEGGNVSSADEAAYNTSLKLGNLKHYSYQVDETFFTTLRDVASENSELGANYDDGTIAAYYKQVANPFSKDYSETEYFSFAASAFTNMTDGLILTPNSYYEIVEQDLAGNLTIYIVYYQSIDDGNGFSNGEIGENERIIYQGINLTDGEDEKKLSDAQILTNRSKLFATSSAKLDNINFLGDKWTRFTIDGTEYMFSPWLENGEVYRLNGAELGAPVSLSSVLGSYQTAAALPIRIANRNDGKYYSVQLTILDGVELITDVSKVLTEESLSIDYSSNVYPVSVKISRGNTEIYAVENDPNSLENLKNSSYNYLSLENWIDKDDAGVDRGQISVSIDTTLSKLKFAFVTLPQRGTKIKYEITDNFGNVTKITRIYGENFEAIGGQGNRYKNLVSDVTTSNRAETYYVSPVSLTYTYNRTVHTVKVSKWDEVRGWVDAEVGSDYTQTGSPQITLTFSSAEELKNVKFRLEVYETNDNEEDMIGNEEYFVENVYFHLYQMLPHLLDKGESAADYQSNLRFSDNYGENITNDILTDSTAQRVMIGGKTYTITKSGSTFASRLTLTYSDASRFDYPFRAYVYKEDGSLGSDFVDAPSGSKYSDSGIYYFLVKYDDLLINEYRLYKVEILNSSKEFYRVTNNGVQVDKAGSYYYVGQTGFSDYYIVNVDWNTSSSLVQIVPNKYQQIEWAQDGIPIPESSGGNAAVVTVRFKVYNFDGVNAGSAPAGVTPYYRSVFITYIPPTSTPVAEATYSLNPSEQIDILTSSSVTAVVDRESSASSIKIRFSSTYGIDSNVINISILKDGLPYKAEVKTETVNSRTYRYVELARSGSYQISLIDTAGNRQVFAAGTSQASTTLKLLFLKDVSFSMQFTDADGNEHITDPIQKGVFNGEVKLNLIGVNEYYTAQSIGSGAQIINVTKNGLAYTGYTYNAETHQFTFTEPGYYDVSFSATNMATGIPIHVEHYNFTIVNPSESRYSFEFAPYDGYYIKSIIKDDIGDITKGVNGQVPEALKELFQTVTINGQEYLKNVVTSALSQITGEGKYKVCIATAQNLEREDYTKPTEFSFEYWINTKSVPIDVSIKEGESTTKNINVSFNAERVFEAVGECNVIIGGETYHVSADTIGSLGTVTRAISATGTHFITVYSISGNLLYSYKVIKTEPLNAWAIAAIVIGCVLVIVAIIIIIKVRKRIKVK